MKFKSVFWSAKNFGDVGRQKELEIIGDGFFYAAHLFGRLVAVTLRKMFDDVFVARRRIISRQLF